MRTADQLIDQATKTGTYLGYWGDGASIPWDQVPVPFDGLLWSYKQYCDARWPFAFRLHDWCYTPLGQTISVTREEADLALRELIERDSVVDAQIIYIACHLFGGQFFGTSLTGIKNHNMAPRTTGGNGMSIKVVMIMKDATGAPGDTNQRVGGWSESVWSLTDDVAALINLLKNGSGSSPGLLPARAALLPKSASIRAVRMYQGGAGKGRSFAAIYPGNSAYETDIPQMALLCSSVSATTAATRRWSVRCIPDVFVVRGEYSPSTTYAGYVQAYFNSLGNFGYLTKLVSPAAADVISLTVVPPTPPATVNTAVIYVTNVTGFANNMLVRISHTIQTGGNPLSAVVRIIDVRPAFSQLVISNWPFPNTTGGRITESGLTASFFNVDGTSVQGVHTRKIGRPSDAFRGRRSKRRIIR